jgi:GNAT superfamily N-acetyltransferase
MIAKVIVADEIQHAPQIRELFWEYLQWANTNVNKEFQVSFDIVTMLEGDMKDLEKFMPPYGRLLLAYSGTNLAGVACLKKLTSSVGEIKRMYVRPGNRQQGLGRALIQGILQEARQAGYQFIRLDSARFMTEAHQLYRSIGFKEIKAYEGSEIPPGFQDHWIFMELPLTPNEP